LIYVKVPAASSDCASAPLVQLSGSENGKWFPILTLWGLQDRPLRTAVLMRSKTAVVMLILFFPSTTCTGTKP
jgi:hypothetical protein